MRLKLLILFFPLLTFAQGYTSYFTGNTTNITTTPNFGICLMGGATEHDNAMRWLLQKANGGDVVVIRTSGSNGYNTYLYSQLGVTVNSVETLLITSSVGATSQYVLNKLANAEMIWFAGGDQSTYVNYFKNNAFEDAINNHVTIKHAPIGGTSAGMMIMGSSYFSAMNGSVTSAQAMSNPYNSLVTIGCNDFLQVPFMSNVITDTHYDNPDRKGRQSTFLARIKSDNAIDVKGIACNEYVAVCIGTDGIAHVYGDYPNYQEFAYFIQPNCLNTGTIETCVANTALTWNFGGEALKVYKVPGTMNGTNYFDVNTWENAIGSGGSWENWSVVNGVFSSVAGNAPNCVMSNFDSDKTEIKLYPNPVKSTLYVDGLLNFSYTIFDYQGRLMNFSNFNSSKEIDVSSLSSGIYLIKIVSDDKIFIKKIIKQ